MSLLCESNLPVRSTGRVDGLESLGLFDFCSKWVSERGVGFRLDVRVLEIDEVDAFEEFLH